MEKFILALDLGTSSTRCVIFNHNGNPVAKHQIEIASLYPRPGWVEHDPIEIWEKTAISIENAMSSAQLSPEQIVGVGITNQRESTVIWNKHTGHAYHNVIVWNDARTDHIVSNLEKNGGKDRFRGKTGLPLATYFSATKILWLFENIDGVKEAATSGEAIFGTLDTWLIWQLTGKNLHITDVSNASRTLLMNLKTLQWDEDILTELDIPRNILPEIRSSSEVYGNCVGILEGVPITGILGDQQAALFGQVCFNPGEAKSTYGTGGFLLLNTGTNIIESSSGVLTTVAYKLGNEETVYALEGAVAYCGALIRWLRDNLGIISDAAESETLAETVQDNGGLYFVPAFSGLFAPYWRQDARGVICGMTSFNNKGHIARAAIEAAAYQTKDVFDAMFIDSNVELTTLKVDGGMTSNNLLMQFQSDILNVPVICPVIAETTVLGAAYVAGLAVNFWGNLDELRSKWTSEKQWSPQITQIRREKLCRQWKKAVTRTFDWVESDEEN